MTKPTRTETTSAASTARTSASDSRLRFTIHSTPALRTISSGARHSPPCKAANGAMMKPEASQAAISVSHRSQRPPKSRARTRFASQTSA